MGLKKLRMVNRFLGGLKEGMVRESLGKGREKVEDDG